MNDIGPRDWVECVEPNKRGFAVGALYLVERVHESRIKAPHCACAGRGSIGLHFRGISEPPSPHSGWCGCGFRPIYRPKAEIMQEITRMVGAPLHERQDA